MTKTLKVILWGEEIGRLAWDERRHLSYFIYNPDFIKKGLNISPLVARLPLLKEFVLLRLFGVRMLRYIRSCPLLWLILCRMPGVISCLTFGDSKTIWQMPTSLLWINSHSSVNEVWVLWNLNQNCLASGKPQR